MNDIIYAGFAQLSYLNWHRLEKKYEKTALKFIFDSDTAFNQIRTQDLVKLYGDGKDYERIDTLPNGVKAKIYKGKDERLLYTYSENETNPNENPKFKEFGDWEVKTPVSS